MKTNLKNILLSTISAILIFGVSAYSVFAEPSADNPTSTETAPILSNDLWNDNVMAFSEVTTPDLNPEEIAALLYMREEEKLARDIYDAMYELWGQPIFQNISASEQKHMDSVKTLLDRYALTDPVLEAGSFSDPNLQSLYDQLIAQGSISLPEALKVGAAIEEIDILDLEERIQKTDHADIQLVFNSLMRGSYNHLNAFTRILSSQAGETYEPQYLPFETYATIVASQAGNGFGNGGPAIGQGRGGFRNGRNASSNKSQ
jgi:hypothetical protein